MKNNIFYKNINKSTQYKSENFEKLSDFSHQDEIINPSNNKKYNPDIELKYKSKELERNEKYKLNNLIYNPITNIIPNNIQSSEDLILKIDDDKYDFKKLLMEKEKERSQILINFNETNDKVIVNENINSSSIKTFYDLKETSTNMNNNNKYNDLLNELKDLGIIN
uniref:Uncharacterized protein n=1 Tax=viral metagenome TaxID=1070528 RepID=A0A6C0EE44_9ZZZZ